MGVQIHLRHSNGEYDNAYTDNKTIRDENDVVIHAKGKRRCPHHEEDDPIIWDYNQAINKPKINGHVLIGDISSKDLGLSEGINDYEELSKIKDYLYEAYYDNIDYSYAYKFFSTTKIPNRFPACSAVRKNNYYGRNLDWFYDENVEFVVKTPHINNRNAVMGVAGAVEGLTNNFVDSGDYSILYKIVPFRLLDGINEKGVVVNTNVVPIDKGINVETIPVVEKRIVLCTLMLPRFVLDYFNTAREAANYLRNYVAIYPPKTLGEIGYEAHWMIADANETLLLEIINNEVIITDMTANSDSHLAGKAYMTNFYLSDIRLNFDGTVFTPAHQEGDHNAITYNHITPNGCGLERYNLISNRYARINSREDMRNLMKDLYYTNSYKLTTNPIWCTEFVGLHGLNVASTLDEYMPVIHNGVEIFKKRTRKKGTPYSNTWQTTHSAIYDIEQKTLLLVVQEDNNALEITYDELLRGGNNDYSQLTNKPRINTVVLDGNKTGTDLSLIDEDDYLTNQEIEELLKGQL